nr:MAG TPA: Radical SAM superfamily [Caudoviricetes sp.]
MKIFDCNKQCKYCPAVFCEERGQYIKTEQTNTTQR